MNDDNEKMLGCFHILVPHIFDSFVVKSILHDSIEYQHSLYIIECYQSIYNLEIE